MLEQTHAEEDQMMRNGISGVVLKMAREAAIRILEAGSVYEDVPFGESIFRVSSDMTLVDLLGIISIEDTEFYIGFGKK
jgi:hypothetical protein